jgi:hypothetical protein
MLRKSSFLAWILLAIFLSVASAEELALSAKQIQFHGIFGNRPGDETVYCLLGSGFIRTLRSGDEDRMINAWLAAHPDAEVVPVDAPLSSRQKPRGGLQYVWIRSGDDYLNVELIREGAFPGGVMVDPSEMLTALPPDTKRSVQVPKRLVSDEQYQAFRQRVVAAQEAARLEQKGVWSEQFKELRDEEDVR